LLVIALIIMLVGAIATISLPIAQYPNIAPPPITVAVVYPGASAETVRDTVIQPIEQQMYGLGGLGHMSANAQADGSAQIVMTFKQGTNPSIAQVRCRTSCRWPSRCCHRSGGAGLFGDQGDPQLHAGGQLRLARPFDGWRRDRRLSRLNVTNPLARISGRRLPRCSARNMRCASGSTRSACKSYGLTISDLSAAISSQLSRSHRGEIGGIPRARASCSMRRWSKHTRFTDPEQFRNICSRSTRPGRRCACAISADVDSTARTCRAP
jgi:multidrug efflux pump